MAGSGFSWVGGLLWAAARAYKWVDRRERARDAAKRLARRRSEFYARTWREAAEAVGATFASLGHATYEIVYRGRPTRVHKNYTELDHQMTFRLVGNKALAAELLHRAHLPTPRYVTCSVFDPAPALRFAAELDGPCVVKPAAGTGGGEGITAGIRDRGGLFRALAVAGALGHELVVEEQVAGGVYRLLYLDGKLLDAVERRPPRLRGDGRASIRELVRRENAGRLDGETLPAQVLLRIDADMRHCLRLQGRSLRSVPAAGESLAVKTVINENRGEENEPACEALGDEVIAQGARAARALGVRFAGVDVITPDPSLPLGRSGGVILEVNAKPGFYYHYHQNGPAYPAAEAALRAIYGLPVEDLVREPRTPAVHG